jgi:hypothetical protein
MPLAKPAGLSFVQIEGLVGNEQVGATSGWAVVHEQVVVIFSLGVGAFKINFVRRRTRYSYSSPA